MKDRYFKYLAAAIIVGVVLAIFNPGSTTERTKARRHQSALSSSP